MSEAPFTLAVASGKGGTGKTLVATNVAAIESAAAAVTLADCDVEAPNAGLFLALASSEESEVTVPLAIVEPGACNACGLCSDACVYGAIRVLGEQAVVFDELCHGCGVCAHMCPTDAITERDVRVGAVTTSQVSEYPGLTLVSGCMDIGQTKSPDVVRSTRARARDVGGQLIIVDAPPGVSCSAVASLRGADAVLLVTEPTAFGLHDLSLAARLTRELGLPMGVLTNRTGTGSADVERFCDHWDIPVVGHLPFDRQIASTYASGGLIVESMPQVAEWLGYVASAMRSVASAPIPETPIEVVTVGVKS